MVWVGRVVFLHMIFFIYLFLAVLDPVLARLSSSYEQGRG